jgi:hypothetical protein
MATRALLTIASLVLAPLAGADLLFPTDRKVGRDRLAFRTHCEPLVHARLDPVVLRDTPAVSQHVHTVTGARSFGSYVDPAADFDSELQTTCNVAQDMSMYWSPALYHRDRASGVMSIVKTTHTHYYLGIGDGYMRRGNKLHAFPRGLRYIMGDNSDRTPSLSRDRASWHCIVDQPGTKNLFLSAPKHASLPPRYAPDGRECVSWQANFNFPNCWDGRSLDSDDHKSHMAFMLNFSECPKSHPILVPQLLFQVEFHLGAVPKDARAADFVLANGDATMASFHADYIAGFDERALGGLMASCERDRGTNCEMAAVAGDPGTAGLHPFKLMPDEEVDGITELVLGPGTLGTPVDLCMQQCRTGDLAHMSQEKRS